ncbi:MAG: hypothetical protein CMF58_03770 [Lentimicrobiaceae bacterium]|jgi:DNA repair protein RadC|nr:hypothetical protein [Lentimicrobiaceae bacterium]MDG2080320.1 DNA repair protein RadC [Bacteroidales bacterium]|tara:strand:+ start:9131 stop:9823 length:693 start_codon:yes stop_codon:yes gene_type:complete
MYNRLPISKWADEDRPREKLNTRGKRYLSKAELIAILISTGNNSESAVELSKRILNSVDNNLAELSKLSIDDLCKFRGIGHAKAITIIASLEIGRRRRADDLIKPKVTIKSSSDAYNIVYASLSDKNYEEFWVILLNRANNLIKIVNISEGGISGTIADPKKIFKLALENNSSAIILAHNHPSNNLKPSESDLKLTKTIYKAGETLEINVLDHIIVGSDNYFSFADESLM